MPLYLEELGQERKAWIALTGPAEGVEVLVKYASPEQRTRFGRKMIQRGLMRHGKDGRIESVPGREKEYAQEFARFYIEDWRGAIQPEGVAYDSEKMAAVLMAISSVGERVLQAIEDETLFFSTNGHHPA